MKDRCLYFLFLNSFRAVIVLESILIFTQAVIVFESIVFIVLVEAEHIITRSDTLSCH